MPIASRIFRPRRGSPPARVVGHKIVLTSRAMQMASKITEPDYGRILDDALCNDGARMRARPLSTC
jgi:2-keto-4-pentenoate hydratase